MNEFLAEMYGTADTIGMTKQAELEKRAEEDFLGRVMAHSFVNELAGIEKEAGWMGALKGGIPGAALGAVPGAAFGAVAGGEGNRMGGALRGGLLGGALGGAGGAIFGHAAQKAAPGILKDVAKNKEYMQYIRGRMGVGPVTQKGQQAIDEIGANNRGMEMLGNYFK